MPLRIAVSCIKTLTTFSFSKDTLTAELEKADKDFIKREKISSRIISEGTIHVIKSYAFQFKKVRGYGVAIFSEPHLNSRRIRNISHGTEIITPAYFTSYSGETWYYIQEDKGWIHELFLSDGDDLPFSMNDRFVFMGIEPNGCEWYIDPYTISKTSDGIINYYTVQKFSSTYRRQVIENNKNAKPQELNQIKRAALLMLYQSIDPRKKLFSNNEGIFYDDDGLMIEKVNLGYSWQRIIPTSPVEGTLIWLGMFFPHLFY